MRFARCPFARRWRDRWQATEPNTGRQVERRSHWDRLTPCGPTPPFHVDSALPRSQFLLSLGVAGQVLLNLLEHATGAHARAWRVAKARCNPPRIQQGLWRVGVRGSRWPGREPIGRWIIGGTRCSMLMRSPIIFAAPN
jgi:hypothetical protein